LLLDGGCKVNSGNSSYLTFDTPLHYAVICGDIEIVKMVLDKGASIRSKLNLVKLHFSMPLRILLDKGPRINAKNNDDDVTPL
jgi:ankyrin repeat protein